MKPKSSIALLSREVIEKSGNMISPCTEIMFAVKKTVKIGNSNFNALVYYDPDRDRRERSVQN